MVLHIRGHFDGVEITQARKGNRENEGKARGSACQEGRRRGGGRIFLPGASFASPKAPRRDYLGFVTIRPVRFLYKNNKTLLKTQYLKVIFSIIF
jgi:hypothetical protein